MRSAIRSGAPTTGTSHLSERRAMMQTWADYLDSLAAGEPNKIVALRSQTGD